MTNHETDAPQRDDAWLEDRVRLLREIHFANVANGYPITTRFGIRARNRFGSIGSRENQTIILVNRLFADPFVPNFVVDGTLAHELAHYAHGFGSGLPRLYQDPHRGGVVDLELERRGLGELNEKAGQWRKIHWDAFYQSRCEDLTTRRTAREEAVASRWNALLTCPGNRTEGDLMGRLAILSPRFGFADPPFEAEWLLATLRQTAPSYWFARSRVVRLHGLLAVHRVPDCMIDFELSYWLARQAVGDNGLRIHKAIANAGLQSVSEEACRWRQKSWTAFRNRCHPLK